MYQEGLSNMIWRVKQYYYKINNYNKTMYRFLSHTESVQDLFLCIYELKKCDKIVSYSIPRYKRLFIPLQHCFRR